MTKIFKLLIPLALVGSLKIDAQSITYGYAFDLGNGADKNTFFEVVVLLPASLLMMKALKCMLLSIQLIKFTSIV